MLADWIGNAESQGGDISNITAAVAWVSPSTVEAGSPLDQALSERKTILVQGYEFSLHDANEEFVTYCRRDSRMSVRIAKPVEGNDDTVVVLVSNLKFAD